MSLTYKWQQVKNCSCCTYIQILNYLMPDVPTRHRMVGLEKKEDI